MMPERRYRFYMASKGQKFNKYSKELKEEIMKKYLNNEKVLFKT